jgi:hypothetical protein
MRHRARASTEAKAVLAIHGPTPPFQMMRAAVLPWAQSKII